MLSGLFDKLYSKNMKEILEKKKILFVIPSLAGGGAERALVLVLRYLDRSRFDPVVVIFTQRNDYQKEIPSDIKIISLNKRGRLDFFRLVVSLSKVIRKESPALICTFLTYANYLSIVAKLFSNKKIPLLLAEQSNLSCCMKQTRLAFLKTFLIRNLYPKSDGIIAVSEGVRDDLVNNFRVSIEKCTVIYNSVEFNRIQSLIKEEVACSSFAENEVPLLLACGRLTTQKNYPMLFQSMQLVLKKASARLLILGEGEERSSLESYAKELEIQNAVVFLGFQKNPFKYIEKATLFILSSSWEGFGNVLVEAMACSVPVISTNCPSGPSEIITDGVNGRLVRVGDEKMLANTILQLLNDSPLRNKLATNGKKRANDFIAENIVKKYERLFEEITQER